MAKSKEEVNKSQAIRDELKANRDKSPIEIAELLKGKGIEVTAQYVSTIKSNMRKSSRAVHKVRKGIRMAGRRSGGSVTNGFQVINAAVELLKVAGGMEQAKAALSTVEEISKAMA